MIAIPKSSDGEGNSCWWMALLQSAQVLTMSAQPSAGGLTLSQGEDDLAHRILSWLLLLASGPLAGGVVRSGRPHAPLPTLRE